MVFQAPVLALVCQQLALEPVAFVRDEVKLIQTIKQYLVSEMKLIVCSAR